jgi:hypothetical protein
MNRLVFGKAVVVGLMLVLVLGGCSKKEGDNGGGGGTEPAPEPTPEPTPDMVTFTLRYINAEGERGTATDEDYSARTSANWDATTKTTTISGWDSKTSNNPMISISFPGVTPQTFYPPPASNRNGTEIRYTNKYGYVYVANESNNWGHGDLSYGINVTKYGPIGSTIEGTFSGRLEKGSDQVPCYEITNGKFRVTRSN